MENITGIIHKLGIIPVIKIGDPNQAVSLANALKNGGLPVAEITFRTDGAADAMKKIAESGVDILLGAGTVLTLKQAQAAKESGAKFIVTPGFNPRIVNFALENDILPIPGCVTPTEIENAMGYGLNLLKFFPAEQSGGIGMLNALAGPYKNISFIPTGGINTENLVSYLKTKNVFAVGGSFMAKEADIVSGNFAKIEADTRLAVSVMHGFTLEHIGINSEDAAQGENTAKILSATLGMSYNDKPAAVFVDDKFEVMKKPFLGKNGHIAIGCNFPDRAEYYFRSRGVEFDENTRGVNPDGSLRVLYFKDEIGGFAFHILSKN